MLGSNGSDAMSYSRGMGMSLIASNNGIGVGRHRLVVSVFFIYSHAPARGAKRRQKTTHNVDSLLMLEMFLLLPGPGFRSAKKGKLVAPVARKSGPHSQSTANRGQHSRPNGLSPCHWLGFRGPLGRGLSTCGAAPSFPCCTSFLGASRTSGTIPPPPPPPAGPERLAWRLPFYGCPCLPIMAMVAAMHPDSGPQTHNTARVALALEATR